MALQRAEVEDLTLAQKLTGKTKAPSPGGARKNLARISELPSEGALLDLHYCLQTSPDTLQTNASANHAFSSRFIHSSAAALKTARKRQICL